eukprot:4676201-Alexandrium_andersonii.AAC.1
MPRQSKLPQSKPRQCEPLPSEPPQSVQQAFTGRHGAWDAGGGAPSLILPNLWLGGQDVISNP